MRKLKTDELNRLSVDQFKSTKKNPVVVVLDNIRSLNNVGSAFRTSDAFLIDKILLCGITGQPPHRDIHKTALGAEETVEWTHAEKTVEGLKKLKEEGYKIIILEHTDKSSELQDFQPNKENKYAFVFGNEVFGVEDDCLKVADEIIEIPQFGTKHSLNVSVSIGVTLWDYYYKIHGQSI